MLMIDNNIHYHIHCKKGDIGRYVFLPGDPFRTDFIAQYLDNAVLIAHNREHKTWTGTLDGEKVSITSTGMGCPSAAIAMEELISCGANTFIRIGTTGRVCEKSYDESLDGIICNATVRDEGTSLQYIYPEYPAVANRHIISALVQAAKNKNLNFIEGITHSKDSFFGQHEPDSMPISKRLNERWETWKASNVMCSEMESSILFVLGSIRNCRSGSIMSFKDMGQTIETACDAVRILIKEDNK